MTSTITNQGKNRDHSIRPPTAVGRRPPRANSLSTLIKSSLPSKGYSDILGPRFKGENTMFLFLLQNVKQTDDCGSRRPRAGRRGTNSEIKYFP